MRKYQPKQLTQRHRAALTALRVDGKMRDVAARFGMSQSQLSRVVHSELGRAYLADFERKIADQAAAALAARALLPLFDAHSGVR